MSEKSVPNDILEQILVRLNMKDLNQCKRVCKSWHSFISGPLFATYLLKHGKRHKRTARVFIHEDRFRKHLIGSSNGLLCIFTLNDELIVVNPLTRELIKLKKPDDALPKHSLFLGGFGYDSSSDDYKVILGRRDYKKDNMMCFHVLSLKSNANWKVVGDVKYSFPRNSRDNSGILCKGALHWFVLDQHKKPAILSFDLSTDEFREIPQPDDTKYKYSTYHKLGMVQECLCISIDGFVIWKYCAKGYNGKQHYWELLSYLPRWYHDAPLWLKMLQFYNGVEGSLFHQSKQWFPKPLEYICAPIYVQSLVSPQVNERPKNPVSPNVNGSTNGLVSNHVNGGLKRKRHTHNGFQ